MNDVTNPNLQNNVTTGSNVDVVAKAEAVAATEAAKEAQTALLNRVSSLEKNVSDLQKENQQMTGAINTLQTQLNSSNDKLSNLSNIYLAHTHIYSVPNLGFIKVFSIPDYPQGINLAIWNTGDIDTRTDVTGAPESQ